MPKPKSKAKQEQVPSDYAVKIVQKKLSELKHDPENPRKITDSAFAGLCKSLERYGYVDPIVYNRQTGEIVGGHRRYDALIKRRNGENSLVDVIEIDITKEEQRELNIALNNQHIQGEFDREKLNLSLEKIDIEIEEYEELRFDKLEINIDDSPQVEPTGGQPQQEQASNLLRCPSCGHEFTKKEAKKAAEQQPVEAVW